MKKLSLELIKRGTSNDQIKSILDEVSISIEDYVSEFKPKDFSEMMEKFGSPQNFCDNNAIIRSREALTGQIVFLVLTTLSLLVVPVIVITSISIRMVPPSTLFLTPEKYFLGIEGANNGYGFLGIIFGLSIYIWMLYQYFKDKFSPYDIRDNVKIIILLLFWFLVVFYLYLVIRNYNVYHEVIADMWNHDMKLIVLEGVIRWLAAGIVLLAITMLYTNKYCRYYRKKNRREQNKFLIDQVGALVIVFVLTSFISPGPGIGVLIIAIAIGTILTGKITWKTWILGMLALLLKLGALISDLVAIEIEEDIGHNYFDRTRIIFGIRTSDAGNIVFPAIIISLCLVIIWTIIGSRILKRDKRQFLPRFNLQKGKTMFISITLVTLALIAVLGSQPHYTLIAENHNRKVSETEITTDLFYKIPDKGRLFISYYTSIEESIDDSTLKLDGSWFLTWKPDGPRMITFKSEGNFSSETDPSYSTTKFNCTFSIHYLLLKINDSGIIHYHFTLRIDSIIPFLTPMFQIQWSPIVPWFKTWNDVTIFISTIVLFFLSWNKKRNIISLNSKKGDA